jgi:hypothetical protein
LYSTLKFDGSAASACVRKVSARSYWPASDSAIPTDPLSAASLAVSAERRAKTASAAARSPLKSSAANLRMATSGDSAGNRSRYCNASLPSFRFTASWAICRFAYRSPGSIAIAFRNASRAPFSSPVSSLWFP